MKSPEYLKIESAIANFFSDLQKKNVNNFGNLFKAQYFLPKNIQDNFPPSLMSKMYLTYWNWQVDYETDTIIYLYTTW